MRSKIASAFTLAFLLIQSSIYAQNSSNILHLDAPISNTIEGGQRQIYTIELEQGSFIQTSVMQKGIDLVLQVSGPGNFKRKVDSPNGNYGPEVVSFEVEKKGTYTLSVSPLSKQAKQGEYTISIDYIFSAQEYQRNSVAILTRAQLETYEGNFKFSDGRILTIGVFDNVYTGMGDILTFLDLSTLRTGALYPHSETEFFTGQTLTAKFPVDIRFNFEKDINGYPNTLIMTLSDGTSLEGIRINPYTREKVSFTNEDTELNGTLYIPATDGPHPLVVYAHGSSAATGGIGFMSFFFIQQGYAVLTFDKRGTGGSTGRWESASLEDLAMDIITGINVVKNMKCIDSLQIGVYGSSQGGWVGSLVASKYPLSFLIVQSGSGVSVAENMVHEIKSSLLTVALAPTTLDSALNYNRKLFTMASNGAKKEDIKLVKKEIKQNNMQDYVMFYRLPFLSWWWNWMKLNGNYDTKNILLDVKCPVLWFLAENDTQVPSSVSYPIIQNSVSSHHDKSKVVLISNAGHSLMLDSQNEPSHYATGFWETIQQWLPEKVSK